MGGDAEAEGVAWSPSGTEKPLGQQRIIEDAIPQCPLLGGPSCIPAASLEAQTPAPEHLRRSLGPRASFLSGHRDRGFGLSRGREAGLKDSSMPDR